MNEETSKIFENISVKLFMSIDPEAYSESCKTPKQITTRKSAVLQQLTFWISLKQCQKKYLSILYIYQYYILVLRKLSLCGQRTF